MDNSFIGLSSSNERIRMSSTLYGCRTGGTSCCFLASRKRRYFEWPNGIQPRWDNGKVSGCGLLLTPKDQLSIFFTVNGILLGEFMCFLVAINSATNFE
jgi:hypothetical protein